MLWKTVLLYAFKCCLGHSPVKLSASEFGQMASHYVPLVGIKCGQKYFQRRHIRQTIFSIKIINTHILSFGRRTVIYWQVNVSCCDFLGEEVEKCLLMLGPTYFLTDLAAWVSVFSLGKSLFKKNVSPILAWLVFGELVFKKYCPPLLVQFFWGKVLYSSLFFK